MTRPPDTYTIGQLSRLSGLPVKTIRFYSDAGVLPERDRTPAGYRLYGEADVARLELVRTLREIGVGLATIRSLGERDLRQVLDLHLRTVESQLKSLQRTRAVLRATLERGDPSEEDLRRLNTLGRIGAAERDALLDSFVAEVGGGVGAREQWLTCLREAMMPELPPEPTIEQLDAWLELVDLLSDDDYRTALRRQSEDYWDRREGGFDAKGWQETNAAVVAVVRAAIAEGVEPGTPEAAPVLDRVVALLARMHGAEDGPELRRTLARGYEEHDPRAEHQWRLVAVINGTPWPPPETIAHHWIARALGVTVPPS
ncbi:MerR family transcriptional regulator [Sphaerisporangium krabiense]|uniref:DNA-binding transcriptional MerR regulator n=1 Tax=Sphaerisporangium krabiense TaxID=763782 RepID=A0A7W8Z617_9ACTN|nr:MerR family transcriptional regulator [Sphaerisporangium krabiense]MBB5627778.1 DNA-binding transcriptional MerR regulator [Sphaerisporangium krabiense]GII61937.1 MerR family transcriptional regulator [Sphaerisporangium krabiense]